MARPFGGRFSPAGRKAGPPDAARQAEAEARRVHAAGARANLMFVPPVVAAAFSITGRPGDLVVGLLAAAVLALGAWLLREGLRAEAAWAGRAVARRPALPRKIAAAALAGLGAGLAALTGDVDAEGALLYGVAAAALHLVAFGIDPLRDKRVKGVDAAQQDRVARAVAEAEGYLDAMREAVAALGDRALNARVTGFQAQARRLIRNVEEDPRDLAGARRYLGVYLMGARDASAKFADLYGRTRDIRARTDYEALLSDLEANFAARTATMLEGGREDVEIEIKVLRDRLQREGVTPRQG